MVRRDGSSASPRHDAPVMFPLVCTRQKKYKRRCCVTIFCFLFFSFLAVPALAKDDVRAAVPVFRGGEDASSRAGTDEVQHSPAGSGGVGATSRRGAGPPQPPAAEDHPLHAPKGGFPLAPSKSSLLHANATSYHERTSPTKSCEVQASGQPCVSRRNNTKSPLPLTT